MPTARKATTKTAVEKSPDAPASKAGASKSPAKPMTLDELLAGSQPHVHDIVARLRKLIKEAAPRAEEKIYGGWKNIGYDYHGLFCYIDPKKDRVNFGFHKGALLPDQEGLMEGTGKGLRHIKIRDKKELKITALKKLVRSACILQEEMEKE